jgi:hypothetical protein
MRHDFRTFVATALMTALLSGLPPVSAQTQTVQPPRPAEVAPRPIIEDQNAEQTRERLRDVLNQYPPSVGQVLRLDPSLLARADYLATYPALAAFLSQHPAVAHNPGYFLSMVRFQSSFNGIPDSPRSEGVRALKETFEGLFFLLGLCFVVGIIGWILRSIIEYRAWLRASKVQTEAHTKVIDRLTTNEDVLAYTQSPVGQRFLSLAAMAPDFGSMRSVGSPVGRILWSVQIGLVLAFGGIGLAIAKNNVIDEAAQGLYVVAVLAIALGIGFVLSSLVAYVLSQRLGLLEPKPSSSNA